MQKGFVLALIMITLATVAIMLVPIPYYQKDTICIMVYPTKCIGGWQLGQPLWKRIFQSNTQQPISSPQPTPSSSPVSQECGMCGPKGLHNLDGGQCALGLECKNSAEGVISSVYFCVKPEQSIKTCLER